MKFDNDYYYKIIEEYNYNPLDFAPFDFEFFSIPKEIMSAKWLCHSGIDKISMNPDDLIITTGVGLSGIPHIGTLSQILRAIFLQKNGLNVQIVLGDLDSYNARNKDLQYVKDLSKKYEDFICKLGFDCNKGVLRNQIEFPEINQLAYYLSKYVTDQDFIETEEDLSKLYKEKKIYDGITFPVKQAILLMVSDFIDLTNNKKDVVVMLGLEEHKYVLLTQKVLQRIGGSANVCAMYSRIIKGLNGYPKMSKSIRGSAISVDMSFDQIYDCIVKEEDNFLYPDDSVLYQMMMAVSDYSIEELKVIHKECIEKAGAWGERKKEYAERLALICKNWM